MSALWELVLNTLPQLFVFLTVLVSGALVLELQRSYHKKRMQDLSTIKDQAEQIKALQGEKQVWQDYIRKLETQSHKIRLYDSTYRPSRPSRARP